MPRVTEFVLYKWPSVFTVPSLVCSTERVVIPHKEWPHRTSAHSAITSQERTANRPGLFGVSRRRRFGFGPLGEGTLGTLGLPASKCTQMQTVAIVEYVCNVM